jgi:HAD superfamily hydrolase (TIGR01509 family)
MAELKAVIFDQDGVIADTERDVHRVAFNTAFRELDLDIDWDITTYGELLKVGGGKERLRYYLFKEGLDKKIKDMDSLIKEVHSRKTEIFMNLLEGGRVRPRPGIVRLIRECRDNRLCLAVCSTSNEKSVHSLLRNLFGETVYGWFEVILAGDVVKTKKPDPEIYNLVKERLGLLTGEGVVIEDNRNGLLAVKGAGLRCIITVNDYTRNEDFSGADLIVSCLGDKDGEKAERLGGRKDIPFEGEVTVPLLREIVKLRNDTDD